MTSPCGEDHGSLLLSAVESAAAHGRGRIDFTDGADITIHELWDLSERVSGTLALRSEQTAAVGLVLVNSQPATAALLGSLRSGVRTVSLPPPFRGEAGATYLSRLSPLLEESACETLLTDGKVGELLRSAGVTRRLQHLTFEDALRGRRRGSSGSGSFVQFSSGTTGDPKGVVLTADAIHRSVTASLEVLEPRPGDVCYTWLPLTHDMGLVGCLLTSLVSMAPQWAGDTRLVISSPEAFVRRPSGWLRAISALRVTHTAAPPGAYALAARMLRRQARDFDLSSLRAAVVGAEIIDADVLREFDSAGQQVGLAATALCPSYGLAEASLGISINGPADRWISHHVTQSSLQAGIILPSEPNDEDGVVNSSTEIVACGRPLPGVEVSIKPNREEVGVLRLRAPGMMTGYLARQSPIDNEGWLTTSDIGFRDDQGELCLVGRSDDVIIVGGRNLHPVDLERCAVRGERSVGLVAAVPFEGTYALVVEMRPRTGDPDLHQDVRRRIVTRLGREFSATPALIKIVSRGAIPTTTSGKVRRSAIAEALMESPEGGDLKSLD